MVYFNQQIILQLLELTLPVPNTDFLKCSIKKQSSTILKKFTCRDKIEKSTNIFIEINKNVVNTFYGNVNVYLVRFK